MVWFIFGIIFFVIAVLCIIARKKLKKDPKEIGTSRGALSVGIVFLVLTVIFMFFACTARIGTKNLGVLTTFGRPSGSLDNGIHIKAPWQAVTQLSDRVQTDTYASDNGASGTKQGGAIGTCVNVRIQRQATACLNVSVKWQIQEAGADYLFRNYKDNDAITDNLVLRNLQVAVNETIGDYNPYNLDAQGNSLNKALSSTSGDSYSADVLKDLQDSIPKVGDTYVVVIQSVNLPLIQFDSKTQAALNSIQAQNAQTQVAQAQKVTNDAQAAANNALAASVNNSPGVLVAECLQVVKDAEQNGKTLPAGFNCNLNTSSSTPVTIPAK